MKESLEKYYGILINGLWVGLVISMPITSMPLVAQLISPGTTVASPAGLFLFVLILIWLIPQLFNKRTFPEQVVPIFVFVLYTFVTALLLNYSLIRLINWKSRSDKVWKPWSPWSLESVFI